MNNSRMLKIIGLVVAALILLPLSVSEIVQFFFNTTPWVAKVNSHLISPQDVHRRVIAQDYQLQMMRQRFGQYADFYIRMMGLDHEPQKLAVENLISDELLNQAADKAGISVSSDYVAEKLSSPLYILQHLPMVVPAHLIDENGISAHALRSYLRQTGLTASEFDAQVTRALNRGLLDSMVTKTTYVPQFVLRDYYMTEFSGKQFSIASLSLDDFLKQEEQKPIAEQELKQFFDEQNAQKKRYAVPEQRSGLVWRFDPANYGITIDSKAIESYYNNHKNDYKDTPAQIQVRTIVIATTTPAAQEKANQIHEQLVAKQVEFADMAKKNSDDKATADKGGLMPLFSQGTHDRDFEKAAFALQNKGDVSPILVTKNGYEILQLVDKKPITYKPLAAVESEIKSDLIQQQFSARFVADARKAIEESKSNPAAITDFIVQKAGKRTVLNKVTASQDPFVKGLFRIAPGTYAADLEGDLGVVVQLNQVEKAYTPSLESIADTVKKDLYTKRAESALDNALRAKLQEAQGKTNEEFSRLFIAPVEKTNMITPKDNAAINGLSNRGITPERIFQLEKVGMVTAAKGDRRGYIIRLDAIEPLNEAELNAKKSIIRKQIQGQEEQLVFGGFVASLYRSAKIKQNESQMNS